MPSLTTSNSRFRVLTSLIKSCVRPLGVDIVKFPPLSATERQLKEAIRTHNINLVIDVGACDGGFCRSLRGLIGYDGQIISFEPCKDTFEKLCVNMKSDSRWRGFNLGISDSDGFARLNTYDRRDFNSVLNLRDADARNYDLDLSKKGVEEIRLRTIDSMWDEIVQAVKDPCVFLKTDTQGHDLAVIRGAQARLTNISGFQCEVPAIEIYDGMTSMPDMIKFLGSLGYVPTAFDAVNRPDAYDGAAPEFNVTFIRSRSR